MLLQTELQVLVCMRFESAARIWRPMGQCCVFELCVLDRAPVATTASVCICLYIRKCLDARLRRTDIEMSTAARPPGKLKWSPEEEEALRAGVAMCVRLRFYCYCILIAILDRYGKGKWRAIQKDARFSAILANRSNIDLKDKWRNLNIKGPCNTSNKAASKRARRPPSPTADSAADIDSEATTAQHMAVIDHVLRVVGFFDDEAVDSPLPSDSGAATNTSASSAKRHLDDACTTVEIYTPHVPIKRPRTERRPKATGPPRPASDDMLLAGVAVDSAARGGSADVDSVCAWVEGHFLVSPLFRDRALAALERLVSQGRLCAVGDGRFTLARTPVDASAELDKAAAVAAAKLTSHVMACVLMQQRWEQERGAGCATNEMLGVERAGLPGLAASH